MSLFQPKSHPLNPLTTSLACKIRSCFEQFPRLSRTSLKNHRPSSGSEAKIAGPVQGGTDIHRRKLSKRFESRRNTRLLRSPVTTKLVHSLCNVQNFLAPVSQNTIHHPSSRSETKIAGGPKSIVESYEAVQTEAKYAAFPAPCALLPRDLELFKSLA